MPLFPLNSLLPVPYFLRIYATPVSSSSIVSLLRAGRGGFVVWWLAAVAHQAHSYSDADNR